MRPRGSLADGAGFLSSGHPLNGGCPQLNLMSGRLRAMTNDSEIGADQAQPGAGTQQMIELMEAEIERLKVALELARAGSSPNRRAMIKNHVSRIDERQDALEKLQTLQRPAGDPD